MVRLLSNNGFLIVFSAAIVLECVVHAEDTSEKYRICGVKLVNMLNVICKKCFQGGGFLGNGHHESAKRTENENSKGFRQLLKLHFKRNDDIDDRSYQWAPDDDLTEPSLYHRPARGPKGIVEECCSKQCPYNTLKSYCADNCPWLKQTK